MSSHLKAELAATCSTLGRLHKGEYLIEPECIESVKDLIRYLKRDNESHDIRRYLGESKVLQNDLIHIVKSCSSEMPELFDVTLRLLINLTTPTMLLYGEEIPSEKTGRNIYLSLIDYEQEYKSAFCDVDFWNQICGKLTNLFETDWAERSADDGIQIERMLMLLRNVLQVPVDVESEKKPENDVTIHDKVLWALRQSQILELLLFVSSNQNEEQYFLNLLEIFSLILREQNPKLLAVSEIQRSATEKNKDMDDLIKVRCQEKRNQNKYTNMRNFNTTYVMKGVKSFSENDIVCHRPLEKVYSLNVDSLDKKHVRVRKNKIPVESNRLERRSVFSVRLFLKEFCSEFLTCSFNYLMNVVKNKLDSGKSLAHDQSYYFWAVYFFLDFATASNSDVNLIKNCLSSQTFHFVQTNMDDAFEHLQSEKKKTVDWIKRIHLILKAYRSLLETLLWMDCHKNPLVRSISREVKSEIFYVVEYREMTLNVLLKYDPNKFSLSYLKDLIETTHLFIKLLEEFSKQTKLVVQKVMRKKKSKKTKKKNELKEVETKEEKWEKIKDDVYDTLSSENLFPEIPPFDAASDVPIDDQKGRAMKKIQNLLHQGNIRDGIGLLRSARQVWPENDCFGAEGLSIEDETMALQEICLADLEGIEDSDREKQTFEEKNEEESEDDDDEEEEEDSVQVVERDFDIVDYKKRLVNKKVIEGCATLLKNYQKNSDHTNHCVIKLLHRIGWECCTPAMLYQASLFWTLLKIMKDKSRQYDEINTFTVNLVRKFRKDASKNPIVFLELLFWKEHNVAMEIQHGYQSYEEKPKASKRSKKKKKSKTSESFVQNQEDSAEEETNPDGFDGEIEREEVEVTQEEKKKSTKKIKKSKKDKKEKNFAKSDFVLESVGEENLSSRIKRNLFFENEEESEETTTRVLDNNQDQRESMESNEEVAASILSENEDGLSKGGSQNSDKPNRKTENSKSKRFRSIGSDSDAESFDSGDEDLIVNCKKRKKLAVIDSDSDTENVGCHDEDNLNK